MAAITITVGATTVCAHAPKGRPRLAIQEQINGRNTAQVVVMDPYHAEHSAKLPGGFLLQQITIVDGSDTIFAGVVTSQRNSTESKQIEHGYIELRATDWTIRLDARRIFRTWEAGEPINSIIGNILDYEPPSGDTLTDEGFTKANTSLTPTLTQRFISDGMTASEILDELSKLTGYIWWVDYAKDIHFVLPGSTAAPFSAVEGASCVWRDATTERTIDNYRNVQWMRQDFAVLAPLTKILQGDGTTTGFQTDFPVGAAPIVTVRTATYAEASISFIGIPTAGDTVTISGVVYTFRATLSAARDVLIGATMAECAQNLTYAINNASAWAGIFFDAATTAHSTVEAVYAGAAALIVRVRAIGTGNGTTLAKSSTNINISSTTLTGAATGSNPTQKSVGVYGVDPMGTADWYWAPGSVAIQQDFGGTPLAFGEYLEVQYHPLFSNSFYVQSASEVAARGPWESLEEAQANSTGSALYATAQSLIRLYGLTGATITEYVTNSYVQPAVNSLVCGMSQTVTWTTGHGFSGSMLVTGISRSYMFGGGTWQSEVQVSGIAYPGSTTDEPWFKWAEFFLPAGKASSIGGGTVVAAGGGGGTVSGAMTKVSQTLSATPPTLNPSVVDGTLLVIYLKQDGTGNRAPVWGSNFAGVIRKPNPDANSESIYLFVPIDPGSGLKWYPAPSLS